MATFAINNLPWRTGKLLWARYRNDGGVTVTEDALSELTTGFYSGAVAATGGSPSYTVEVREVVTQGTAGFDASSTIVLPPTNYLPNDDLLPSGSSGVTPTVSITFTRSIKVAGVLTDADSLPLLTDEDGTYGVRRLDNGAIIVAALGGTVDHVDTGRYSFTLDNAIPGVAYEASFQCTVRGQTVWSTKTITADVSDTSSIITGVRFEYVPVLNGSGNAKLRVVNLDNLSTKHDDPWSDRGRLYATITKPAGVLTVSLFSDVGLATAVAMGTGALGAVIPLPSRNNSGISGRVIVESYTADEPLLMLLATFAVDQDVIVDETQCSSLPGYDSTFGLAFLHAEAMRRILTSELPAALPYLYGITGLASYLPRTGKGDLPDLTTLANADQLREAQADMVKWLSAKQAEHVKEFADLAKVAQANFREAMDRLKEANRQEPVAEAQEHADDLTVSFGSFRRG